MKLIDADRIRYEGWFITLPDGSQVTKLVAYKSEIDHLPEERGSDKQWIRFKAPSGRLMQRCPVCGKSEVRMDGKRWLFCPSCGQRLE